MLFLLCLASARPVYSKDPPSDQDTARLADLAILVKSSLVDPPHYLYHWASAGRAKYLLHAGKLGEQEYAKVKGDNNQADGPGFYTSTGPTAWSDQSIQPDVVIAQVPPGTKFLEAGNPTLKSGLFRLYGISPGPYYGVTKDPIDDERVRRDLSALGIAGVVGAVSRGQARTFVITGPEPDIPLLSLQDLLARFSALSPAAPHPTAAEVADWIELSWEKGDIQAAREFAAQAQRLGIPYVPPATLVSSMNPAKLRPLVKAQTVMRRLVDPEHYTVNLHSGIDQYGAEASDSWVKATARVETLSAQRLPTFEDLFEIHGIAYGFPGRTFDAYYKSRIAQAKPAVRARASKLLEQKRFDKLRKLLGINEPFGTLRDGNTGFNRAHMEGKTGAFSPEEINRLDGNPFLRRTKLKPQGSAFSAAYTFPPGDQVEGLTRKTFAWLADAIQGIPFPPGSYDYERDVIRIAADFYYRLISIHPMWDGNGRTAKLLRDWVLMHFGLPPPDSTPSQDLEMTPAALAAALRRGILQSIKERVPPRLGLTVSRLHRLRDPSLRGLLSDILSRCVHLLGRLAPKAP